MILDPAAPVALLQNSSPYLVLATLAPHLIPSCELEHKPEFKVGPFRVYVFQLWGTWPLQSTPPTCNVRQNPPPMTQSRQHHHATAKQGLTRVLNLPTSCSALNVCEP